MKADIRVDADFVGNPKTQRLIRELGDKAVVSLIALWGYAARNRPKGVLHGLSPEDISMVSRWEGDPKAFVGGLARLRWLEKRGNTYSIHDWEIHQPYIFYSEERSEAARKAVETRWKKQRGEDTERIRNVYGSHAPDPTPTPIPNPVPLQKTKTSRGKGAEAFKGLAPAANSSEVSPQLKALINGMKRDIRDGIMPIEHAKSVLFEQGRGDLVHLVEERKGDA